MSFHIDFHIDIVICLDVSGDMAAYIDKTRGTIKFLPEGLVEYMEMEGKSADKLRVKFITFSDFATEGADAIHETKFFDYFEQKEEAFAFIDGVQPKGGGDKAENALEALALAIKSDWTTEGKRRRHVIIMITNAPAHSLQYRSDCEGYPAGMPADLAELGDWWAGMAQLDSTYDYRMGRLIIFAPEATPWTDMEGWSRYWFTPDYVDKGFSEFEIADIFSMVFGS